MKLESNGIILGMRPFGERDAVAHIFTADFGLMVGMLRGALVAKKSKPLVGQCGNVYWGARLDDMLGVFRFESIKNMAAPLMLNSRTLMYMNSAFALLSTLLPERVKYDALYNKTLAFLERVADPDSNSDDFYLDWEICLLSELGYALDLSRCSGCGGHENLTHISPKTARAVCGTCAAPYAGRLFSLPVDLNTMKFFLSKIVVEHGAHDLPIARNLI